jgi:uncharacterized protein YjbI with pentapeptide repeats
MSRMGWVVGIVSAIAFLIVAFGGYIFEWEWTGYPKRKPWDWLELLSAVAIPVVIAVGGFRFARSENKATRDAAKTESQATRDAANQRTMDEALQAYLDQVGQLLLGGLRKAPVGDEKRTLARARTLTVLARLNGARKGSVMQFLYEAELIGQLDQRNPEGTVITWPTLPSIVNLKGADLKDADLDGASLFGADLRQAELIRAYLRGAALWRTDLREAKLRGAKLRRAQMEGAYLSGADLSGADLSRANLSRANLFKADLSNANLSGADLSEIRGRITNEQLKQAKSLDGATMPDGQILKSADNPDRPTLEEWLKSKGRE